MTSTTEFRKTITDPTPLYFAAGVIEKVRIEAPDRIAKVRATDPKVVQERFQEVLATLDADIKKLREQAQTLALQGVGYAAEAAVKAKENYDTLAEQGKNAVESWRGQDDEQVGADVTYETTIQRESAGHSAPKQSAASSTAPKTASSAKAGTATKTGPKATPKAETKSEAKTGAKTEAKTEAKSETKTGTTPRTAAKKTTARKTTPKPGA